MPQGLFLLTAASFSVAFHVWLSRGLLFAVPRTPEAAAEYVFISASFGDLDRLTVIALACIAFLHAGLRYLAKTDASRPPLLSGADTAYARPLLLFAVSSLALLNLVPGIGRSLGVFSYVIVDLRWWWTPLILFWTLVRIDQRLHGKVRATVAPLLQNATARRWAPETAIVALAVGWVVMGTPHLRFSGVTAGDEAKYLRYCELLYQGQGFELSHIKPIGELPPDYRPELGRNLTLMAQIVPEELHSLTADIGVFIRDPFHQFNKAGKAQGRFFTGKNGGTYQVHSPGISFLMFPAYYLNRQFGGPGDRPDSQWPARLTAVNGFFLALYAVWVALFFRFVRRVVESTWAAWMTTLALMLTMPAATFPFQFYPELAAGVLLIWVAGHILFPDRSGTAASAFAGVLAGYLPWLHVRFSAMAMMLVVFGVIALRGSPRRAAALAIGSMVPLGFLSLYAYHLTGSILPWAMWQEASGREMLTMQGAIRGGIGYLVDRDWGLLAHAPVTLLALPGYWLLARRRPDVALLCGMAFLSLLLPAAGHTLTAAGSTPMRLIVAVVPLAAMPLAELLVARGHVLLLRVAFALLLVLSLDTALAYNLYHYKSRGLLEDWSVSGWKTNLLFPPESRELWAVLGPDLLWLGSWILMSIVLLRATATWERSQAPSWRVPSLAAACVALFIVLGSVLSAATGNWQETRYRIPVRIATAQASTLLDDIGQCSLCLSSSRGRLNSDSMRVALREVARPRKRRGHT